MPIQDAASDVQVLPCGPSTELRSHWNLEHGPSNATENAPILRNTVQQLYHVRVQTLRNGEALEERLVDAESDNGEWFHSALSKHGVEFKEKRVFCEPIVGPRWRRISIEVAQFIRTPSWYIPKLLAARDSSILAASVRSASRMCRSGEARRRRSPAGLETTQGEASPADVIIFAAGFTVYPPHVRGVDGKIIQGWCKEHGGPTVYLGTTVPGLSNFYMVSGAPIPLHLLIKSQSSKHCTD
ncbi:hypothetical protein FIBSPDRAFT_1053628 [Athelia psychrophila]|uniref:FAD/NAD(P)-binding domain-containing protein n=1 Tax=Athelia psychrophila TaxID=1759441 RepID=A0A167WMA6_9AGAM|nr:hypothetical protein FIBSPDRAFT_1053628 [Fibularhizoctonia sp. CBS 109695]